MMDVRSSTDYLVQNTEESYNNKVLDYSCYCGYDHCITLNQRSLL